MADPPGSARSWISPDRPHLPPPAVFLAAAVLGFPIVAAFVVVAAAHLARLDYHAWPVLVANHLVTLGWGTMVAVGALYQLYPAAAGVRRDPPRTDAVAAVFYITAVVAMAAGFWFRWVPAILAGGSALVGTVLLLDVMAWRVTVRRRRWSWPLTYAATAMLALLGVMAWGLLLAANWRWAFWPALLGPLGLGVHLPLGLVGWFGLLVTGISYYLLPRFADHRATAARFASPVYAALVAGMLGLVAGAGGWTGATRLGLGLLGVGGLLYAADVWDFVSSWRGRGRDITRLHWMVIAAETVALSAGLIAHAVRLLPGDPTRWAVAAVVLFLLGWLTLAIMGQVYKVTPFLMWFYRFYRRIPAYEVPRLPAPYWPAPAPWALAATALGGLMVSGAILLDSVLLAQIGGIVFLIGSVIFSATIGYSWIPTLVASMRTGAR